ncbi:MAG TPA: FAD-binding oxidoreductase, partial [Actinopolymorphaceae bacterium]
MRSEVGQRLTFTGWGRTTPSRAEVARPRSAREVATLLADPPPRGLVPRGLGRSYGDAAQDAGGLVVDCTRLAPDFAFDPATGVLTCAASLSFDRLMRDLIPLGWFLPVTPGTRYVTVGGAIAADVHGKNHHVDGSFGAALLSIELVLPGGAIVHVGPDSEREEDRELFWATVGGMGLTGVITAATFRCRPIETSRMLVDTERADDLEDALARMSATDDDYRYTVAWIDLLAKGPALGRSVLTRGDHATVADLPARHRRSPLAYDPKVRLAAPPWAPSGLLNRATIRAFNELWFRKAPRVRRGEVQSLAGFFHPLDGVAGWNRLYGARGMLQYQFVVPFGAEDALRAIVSDLATTGIASFLAVLKRLGPGNPGPLSFPMPGWTLALDIPLGDGRLAGMLRAFDEMVASAGGRVYLAKDAVLDAAALPSMYPHLKEFRAVRSRVDPSGVLRS